MVKALRVFLLMFALGFIASPATYAQTLAVQVDRDALLEQETLQLTISLQGQSNASPDLAPVEQDFDVVSSSKNHTINLINGRLDSKTVWQITLLPKRSGTLRIPPLTIAGEVTEPISVVVRPANTSAASKQRRNVFLDVTATPDNPYVQSQILVTVRLYYAVPVNQARMAEPTISNAMVERLGDDKNFESVKDGHPYRVLERVYAIFPQNSGELIIPALEFNGQVTVGGASPLDQFLNNNGLGIDPFDQSFQRTQPVRLRSTPIHLKVRPRPAKFSGTQWLPAQALTLTETWNPSNPAFRVGDPVTRSIAIVAKGLAAAQLPELPMNSDISIKNYPDQAQLDNTQIDNSIQGTRVQKIALVPTQPGTFILPALHLYWWDTLTHQERIATLPAVTIKVLPAANSSAASLPKDGLSNVPLPTPSLTTPTIKPSPATKMKAENSTDFWAWVAIFFCIIWIVTLGVWWRDRRRRLSPSPILQKNDERSKTAKPSLNALQTACEKNQAPLAKKHLLLWAATQWPEDPPHNIGDIASRLEDKTVSIALNDLDKAIYAQTSSNWNGSACWNVLKPVLTPPVRPKKQTETSIPALYPRN